MSALSIKILRLLGPDSGVAGNFTLSLPSGQPCFPGGLTGVWKGQHESSEAPSQVFRTFPDDDPRRSSELLVVRWLVICTTDCVS